MQTVFPSHYPTVQHIIETTEFRDREHALGALEALYWLEQGAPHQFDGLDGIYQFDMGEYVSFNSCGTVCCIAGAIQQFKTKGNKPTRNLKYGELLDEFNIHERSSALYDLFMAQYIDDDGFRADYMFHKIPPKVAGQVLFLYLTTGKVDWKRFMDDYDES